MIDIFNIDLDTLTPQELQARARAHWIASRGLGEELTGAQLAVKFDRSERWGRDRIAEARRELELSSPVPAASPTSLPPVVAMTPPTTPVLPSPAAAEPVPASPVAAAPGGTADDGARQDEAAAPAPAAADSPTGIDERQEAPAAPAAAGDDGTSVAAAAGDRQSRLPLRIWPLWLLMLPAAVAIWGGWVGLGELAGFGPVRILPGIYDSLVVNTAITLPIGMEVYAAYAMYVWLSGRARGRALRFARNSAITSLVVGAAGQIAYHVMAAAGVGIAPWWVTAGVACLPVAVLGMGAALAHMVRAETETNR